MALSQEDQTKLTHLKTAHDCYATILMHYQTRFQFYAEEFEGIHTLIGFVRAQKEALTKAVYELEPPVPKEAPAAYAMDLTHVKGETQVEQVTQ